MQEKRTKHSPDDGQWLFFFSDMKLRDDVSGWLNCEHKTFPLRCRIVNYRQHPSNVFHCALERGREEVVGGGV